MQHMNLNITDTVKQNTVEGIGKEDQLNFFWIWNFTLTWVEDDVNT